MVSARDRRQSPPPTGRDAPTLAERQHGTTQSATLTYTYDGAGHRVAQGGTWAPTALPAPVFGMTYDEANDLTTVNTTALDGFDLSAAKAAPVTQ